MVKIEQPLCSGWASGSIFKTITFRALYNQRFCMHRFRHTRHRRTPAQIFYQDAFAEKIRLYKNWARIAELKGSLFGNSTFGITIFGGGPSVAIYLDKIPPLNVEE